MSQRSELVITDVQSALDLLMSAKYDIGTKNIAIDKNLIVEDFFILSRGLAGEILQKYINYGGRIAIYGDPDKTALMFICKRLRLNYGNLPEEEKKWLKRIAEKSDLLKNPNSQRGRKKK